MQEAGFAAGTDFWWATVQACRSAKGKHPVEEELDVIPGIWAHTESGLGSERGLRWRTFNAEHCAARGISEVDVDLKASVRDNS